MADQDLSKDMFDFMQKMWNPMSFAFPGVMAPTIDPKEIEKRIAELRTVESWLRMNLGFIDMTIKTMELQKAAFDSLASGTQNDKSG